MEFYNDSASSAIRHTNTSAANGLSKATLTANVNKYGYNALTPKKKIGFFGRLASSLTEPMIIILLFSFVVAFGTSVGSFIKSGEGDFTECIGILAAIALSVSITLIMEGSSQKAFDALSRAYDNLTVKVVREGQVIIVNRGFLTVGDIVLLSAGDKIVCDGRLIESTYLSVDESALTGESGEVKKEADLVLPLNTPLAERKNCVYSGSFVKGGEGKMVVTAVGDNTEIGKIAVELQDKKTGDSPLQQKLNKLSKTITLIGAVVSGVVFIVSLIKLWVLGGLTFSGAQELFISSIILIVAAVPEGLPTIVAVSLALNMIKLARENALIKKMLATETAGAVSVICSDKTGTLTQNKMAVVKVCSGGFCGGLKDNEYLRYNFLLNSTATIVGGKKTLVGSGTEGALLSYISERERGLKITDYRKQFPVSKRIPFSAEKKFMITSVSFGGEYLHLIKGAPERVLDKCILSDSQRGKLLEDIEGYQKKSGRVIAFAHKIKDGGELDFEGYVYDGFAVISDPVRPDVKKAVKTCKRAGIGVIVLTGDNAVTALAVATELGIASSTSQVVSGSEIDGMDDATLTKALAKIRVVARCTPIIKLRIVKLLKASGEVVAVTGDGINDAPAIKSADIGIAMGVTGSEITKEAADVILLDDSFATIVKAISFGRNVYRNLQRFIIFQLSVNLTALLFITVCAFAGLEAPFNTLQLLWINVIMDGPPAITLGLDSGDKRVMSFKPIGRGDSIVTVKMLARIIISGVFMACVLSAQYLFDFLGAGFAQKKSAVFTLFILFQLFNAFNCRELGSESIFKRIGKNKIMIATFTGVLLIHIIISQCFPVIFGVTPMSVRLWVRCFALALSVVGFSELYKLCYRLIKGNKNQIGA